MKNVYYSLALLFSITLFVSCEADSLDENGFQENLINDQDSTFEVSALDKEDGEAVGTRD